MPDPTRPGDLPPDVPEEYAEAYRRGYERAQAERARLEEGRPGPDPSEPAPAPPAPRPLFVDEVPGYAGPTPTPVPPPGDEPDEAPADEPTRVAEVVPGLFGDLDEPAPGYDDRPEDDRPEAPGRLAGRPAWLVVAALATLVVVLVGGAYAAGRILSATVDSAEVAEEEPGVVLGGTDTGTGTGADAGPAEDAGAEPSGETGPAARWSGPVRAVTPVGGAATCQSPDSVDAAGNPVGYAPPNAFDGDFSTAWRCYGDGVGERLTLVLPGPVPIGEVGVVPGYAKTDPRSGVDRYAENNRATRVRWWFADGTSVVQRLDGAATRRDLQTVRVPRTRTDEVVVEILASTPGPRNTVAISEVRLGAAVG